MPAAHQNTSAARIARPQAVTLIDAAHKDDRHPTNTRAAHLDPPHPPEGVSQHIRKQLYTHTTSDG
jgi:hypothetical protein